MAHYSPGFKSKFDSLYKALEKNISLGDIDKLLDNIESAVGLIERLEKPMYVGDVIPYAETKLTAYKRLTNLFLKTNKMYEDLKTNFEKYKEEKDAEEKTNEEDNEKQKIYEIIGNLEKIAEKESDPALKERTRDFLATMAQQENMEDFSLTLFRGYMEVVKEHSEEFEEIKRSLNVEF